MSKETSLPLADERGRPVRWRRYGPNDRSPIPRDGKTHRDKHETGAYHNRLANLAMRGEESRGGGRKKGKRH